jgi:hypothetical protein
VFALKVPVVNVTVNTLLSMEAVPAAPVAGDVNVTAAFGVQLGEPVRVTISLALDGYAVAGVNVSDIITAEADAITLDSEIAGDAAPIDPLMMAGKVPSRLVP